MWDCSCFHMPMPRPTVVQPGCEHQCSNGSHLNLSRPGRLYEVMGDPDGFEAFFRQHRDPVVRALTLVFGERGAAEDAAQVGFERAFARWHRVGTYERPATWVYVVALRHGRRQLRPMEGPHG